MQIAITKFLKYFLISHKYDTVPTGITVSVIVYPDILLPGYNHIRIPFNRPVHGTDNTRFTRVTGIPVQLSAR